MEVSSIPRKAGFRSTAFILASLFLAVNAGDSAKCDDWPCWRGPNANSVADGGNLPVRWSKSENIQWSVKLPGWGTSSPVVYGNRVFVTSEVEEGGKKSLLTLCFDREDGKERYRKRLGGDCNSTPIASDGRIYVSNNDGTTFVVQAGGTFELLSTNALGERITASPAISRGELIYRTDSHLYCIGRKP